MAAERLRIGFVGVGRMGQCAHLKNYASLPDCQVVAIAEPQADRARKVAARYGIPKVYANHQEMLSSEKLDGIVAAQRFTRHGILLPDLLKAGVPVFTEKPIAGSPTIGRTIVDSVCASGTWLMVGYHKRSDPAVAYAKAEIDRLKESRQLGELKYVRITMPAGDWIAGGFADLIGGNDPAIELEADPPPADLPGGLYSKYVNFVEYYIHQVNLMRHLLGEAYEVTYADPSGVMLAGQSQSGTACVIEMTPYRTTLDWQESALVCFEKGYVKVDLPAPLASNRPGRVEMFCDPGSGAPPQTIVPQLPWVHAMRQQAINFLRAIRGEIKPPCDAVEALEDLRVAREYLRLWKEKKKR
ncbi:Gfo/Idh/MocA family protein [Bradyrhizobium tunisiense]|uniref:Gfo/Idh/MocA family protein n=1 Tax=Bradyrhizobium tunisiense TaxID=3278709 RepID=UPI0035D70A99